MDIINGMGLGEANGVATPGDKQLDDEELGAELEGEKAKTNLSIVAKANYLALDRPDIQQSVQELARHMSKPFDAHWNELKRLARFLITAPKIKNLYPWGCREDEIAGYSDSNWAGDKRSRKSTSGGAILWGRGLVKSWSKGQSVIALSSAEAELYAAIKTSCELLGIITIMGEWGMMSATNGNEKIKGTVYADASAALGIIGREGIGRVRRLETQHLWIQEKIIKNMLSFEKVGGERNPADMMTKALSTELMRRHMERLGCAFCGANMVTGRRGSAGTRRSTLNPTRNHFGSS